MDTQILKIVLQTKNVQFAKKFNISLTEAINRGVTISWVLTSTLLI